MFDLFPGIIAQTQAEAESLLPAYEQQVQRWQQAQNKLAPSKIVQWVKSLLDQPRWIHGERTKDGRMLKLFRNRGIICCLYLSAPGAAPVVSTVTDLAAKLPPDDRGHGVLAELAVLCLPQDQVAVPLTDETGENLNPDPAHLISQAEFEVLRSGRSSQSILEKLDRMGLVFHPLAPCFDTPADATEGAEGTYAQLIGADERLSSVLSEAFYAQLDHPG